MNKPKAWDMIDIKLVLEGALQLFLQEIVLF